MQNKMNSGNLLFVQAVVLTLLGILLLFSASHGIGAQGVFQKQIVWVVFGVVLFFAFRNLDYRHWAKLSVVLYFLLLFFLLLVLAFGTGRAGRWIRIGFVNFQPSEFMKIILVILLARYFSGRDVSRFPTLFGGLIITGIPFLLVLAQPNLGTAGLFLIIFFSMAYLAGAQKKHLAAIFLIGILMSPFMWMALKDYQKQRILIFLNPARDPLGKGYNILQSKMTIGSGGIIGKGFLHGTQTKLAFLPEYHTDFIFCLLAEEFGLFGVALLLFLYYLFLNRIWNISLTTQDPFGRLAGVGMMAMFLTQIFVNIGMACGILPVVGIPLPFLSYGGSALLVAFVATAIVYNLDKNAALF
jgi:rod shape determining protein RodA